MGTKTKKTKKKEVVNYSKIKRDLIMRDTNGDSRFTPKVVESKTKKKPKYRPDYFDGTDY